MNEPLPSLTCPNCLSLNERAAKFCNKCGQSLAQICATCGAENQPDATTCRNCGEEIIPVFQFQQESNPTVSQKPTSDPTQEKVLHSSPKGTEQRKPVSILFADIVGSTTIAEKLDPEEWKAVVAGAHRRVSEAVNRYEGTIAQLLGDGVLVFFGAPVTHEDDPVRAVCAAMDIQTSMGEYRHELAGFVDDFQMRIGIHTGEVVLGEVEAGEHVEYLAMGDAVNVAARLQSAAEPGGILISESCARMVDHEVELEDRGAVQVKGKKDPIRAYEVHGLLAEPTRARGLGGERTPYVGREDELNQLKAAVQSLCEDRGGIVAILGEAGIGKTRLLEEVRTQINEIDEHPKSGAFPPSSIRWLEGRALSYGEALSNWVIAQLLLSDLGLSDGAPRLKIKVALRKRVDQLLGEEAGGVYPYLARLLDVELEEEEATKIQQLGGETLRHQTKIELGGYFEAMAKEKPTAFVLEDLQWADPTSLETLGELLWLTEWVPLLMIFLTREERDHPSWGLLNRAEKDFPKRFIEINLHRLDPECAQLLAEMMIHATKLPTALVEKINARAEGNPFYVEELVKHLLESKMIQLENGEWVVTDQIDEIGIPETLQGVLLARIDRLEEDVRETLQMASVIGKSFLYKILAAVSHAEHELQRHLTDLQRIDLVREKTRIPDLEYMFKHSLTQEASYNSILIERRRKFHRMVGETLKSLFPERINEFLGLLAHHFEQAGDQTKAADYYIRAGDKTRFDDAHTEALESYHKALVLLEAVGDDEREYQIWLRIAQIHQADFQFEASHRAYERAFAIEEQLSSHGEGLKIADTSVKGAERSLVVPIQFPVKTLDLVKIFDHRDIELFIHLFCGLVRIDRHSNVVPQVAKSWEVLDDGLRYRFHLRNDVFWTNGDPVTADDFVRTWLRTIRLAGEAFNFNDIVGVEAYLKDEIVDTSEIGICALDPTTLEVRLRTPIAYFLYLIAMCGGYALPVDLIEERGEDWWKPENIISNGPFILKRIDEDGIRLERNPKYFGRTSGNLDAIEWVVTHEEDKKSVVAQFFKGDFDLVEFFRESDLPETFPEGFQSPWNSAECCYYLIFNPNLPCLQDPLVRKALAHALDLEKLLRFTEVGEIVADGGLIPPGIPGHSKRIGIKYDITQAQKYLAKAGFPNGEGFPTIKFQVWQELELHEAIAEQWHENLGIQVEVHINPARTIYEWPKEGIAYTGWATDFPDPHNFLWDVGPLKVLRTASWRHPRSDAIVQQASITPDRSKRLSLYREADRILVEEELVIFPLFYQAPYKILLNPKVKNFQSNVSGFVEFENIIKED